MRGLDDLLAGYERFKRDSYPRRLETYRALAAEGQSPKIMIVGCCDSRVDPAGIFDAGPGELFVARNVANLVPPFSTGSGHHGTSAAIEFAVSALGVAHIVVLGHGACGGIAALMGGAGGTESENSNINRWMSIARPALEKTLESGLEPGTEAFAGALEKAAIGYSLANLRGFPSVSQAMAAGRLEVHGAWFGIETGELQFMDPGSAAFLPVVLPVR
jgi:carbonic anhydrase